MVTIRKRQLGNQEYYYLEHTVRKKGKVEKLERYLGKSIPKDIESQKREFLFEIYKARWNPLLEVIKSGYSKDQKATPPSARSEEIEKFAIHFTYDTQRIEGSTLSIRETNDLLAKGITPNAKPMRDVKEAEAHKALFDLMISTKEDISIHLILHWHRLLFQSTRPDIAGKIREHQVAISGSKFLPPSPVEIMPLISDFFRWYNKNKAKTHPVELAALVHLKFVTIHPFSDGNGRISRLLMNHVLNRSKHPLLNIHYEGRDSYYTALERSQTKNLDFIFVHWFVKRYIKENQRFIRKK